MVEMWQHAIMLVHSVKSSNNILLTCHWRLNAFISSHSPAIGKAFLDVSDTLYKLSQHTTCLDTKYPLGVKFWSLRNLLVLSLDFVLRISVIIFFVNRFCGSQHDSLTSLSNQWELRGFNISSGNNCWDLLSGVQEMFCSTSPISHAQCQM